MSIASRIHGAHQHAAHQSGQPPEQELDQQRSPARAPGSEQDQSDAHEHEHGRFHAEDHGHAHDAAHRYDQGDHDGHGDRDEHGDDAGHQHHRAHPRWHAPEQSHDEGHSHGRSHDHGHSHARNADTPGFTLDHSRKYDSFTSMFFLGRRAAVFRKVARLSGAKPGHRALDVGCGTGYLSSMLAAAVGPQGSVTGVDASAAMVAAANELRSSANCTYSVGAAERLEFDDGTFDVVTSSLMIHHLPSALRVPALREMRRVLRPGGQLLIAEFRPPRTRLMRHVVGSLTSPAMLEDQRLALPGLFREAGFDNLRTGDLRPWITYASAVRD